MTKEKIVSKEKRPMGRPQKPIDWDLVEKAIGAGCEGVEIAAHLGIHPNTLYERTVAEHGITFSEYLSTKREKGESILRMKQFQVAMNGNVSMLIWLGKNRLGQRENPKDDAPPNDKILQEILDSIKGTADARPPALP